MPMLIFPQGGHEQQPSFVRAAFNMHKISFYIIVALCLGYPLLLFLLFKNRSFSVQCILLLPKGILIL